jgi:hypothetical protein
MNETGCYGRSIPALLNKSKSCILLPITCMPKGNPSFVFPMGMTMTGFAVNEKGVVNPMFASA